MCEHIDPTPEERTLARALYEAMRKASPDAWMPDSAAEAESPEFVPIDGRFSFPLVVRYFREALSERGKHTIP